MNEFHAILVVVNYFFNLLNSSMKKKFALEIKIHVDVKSAGKLSLHVHLLANLIFCEENPVAFIVH